MLLGKAAKGRVVKPINSVDESGYVYPLNVVEINGHKNQYAFVMGVTHTVCNFDGRIIAALIPKDSENKNLKTMWIMASRSSRYINQDILQVIDVKNDFPQYNLICYYESSAGAVVYRSIKGKLRYLLIKNKRSSNWGFPKGYEGISKYKLRNNVDKKVSIFVATTDDMRTIVQEEEIDDFMWLAYDQAIGFLSFENDKKILREAVDFLLKNNLIVTKDIPLPQDVQKEMEIKEKLRQERIAQMERQKQFNPPQKSKQQIRYENYKKKQKQKYKENLKKSK